MLRGQLALVLFVIAAEALSAQGSSCAGCHFANPDAPGHLYEWERSPHGRNSVGCEGCHGTQGTLINFGTEAQPLYLADLAAANPWRTVHKIRFGTLLDLSMPASEELGWSLSRVADVLAYAQSLERGNPALRPFNPVSTGSIVVESQGRIEPLVWASALIFLIIAAGVAYDYRQQQNRPKTRKH